MASGPLLTVSLLALAAAEAVQAQGVAPADVETRITPDMAAGSTLGTTVTQAAGTYTIDGGRVAGANLFHSFARFDVGQGDVARWTHGGGDAASIANVVNRIVGGDPSHIFGTLDSTALPNADFYFINPAGILFGEGASVNVPAAAHFSTASELRFASGPAFQVAEPNGTLSIASPEAFGFRGDEGAMLLADLEEDFVPATSALGLSAAEVRIEHSEFTPGSLALAAIGPAAASVPVAGSGDFAREGEVVLLDTIISTHSSAAAQGGIALSGGEVRLSDALLLTETDGDADGGDVVIDASRVVIDGTSAPVDDDDPDTRDFAPAAIVTRTTGTGRGGNVIIGADDVTIDNSGIGTFTSGCAADECGDGGSIRLSGGNLRLEDSFLSSASDQGGRQGVLEVELSGSIELAGSRLSTEGYNYETAAGAISLSAPNIVISGSEISVDDYDPARVTIGADDSLVVDGGSTIFVRAVVDDYTTDSILLSGSRILIADSKLYVEAHTDFFALEQRVSGSILVTGDSVRLDHAFLTTSARSGFSSAGRVAIDAAGTLDLIDSRLTSRVSCRYGCDTGGIALSGAEIALSGSYLDSNPESGAAIGGPVTVDADGGITVTGSTLSSSVGGVAVKAGADLLLAEGSSISVGRELLRSVFVGDFVLSGRNVTIDSSSLRASIVGGPFSPDGEGIGSGSISATQALRIRNGSTITLTSFFLGGGSLSLSGDSVHLSGSRFSTAANFGNGGPFSVTAGESLTIENMAILSNARFGRAGDITLVAPTLTVGGSTVSSSADLASEGGSILIDVVGDALFDRTRISTDAVDGAAGGITLALGPDSLLFLQGTQDDPTTITTSAASGNGGRITIGSPLAIIATGSEILALGESGGANVVIDTRFFIASADRPNRVEVEGNLRFENPVTDVSAGTVDADLAVLDASGVLRGQCPAVRASGQLSQLSVRPVGPYVAVRRFPSAEPPQPAIATGGAGGCQ